MKKSNHKLDEARNFADIKNLALELEEALENYTKRAQTLMKRIRALSDKREKVK